MDIWVDILLPNLQDDQVLMMANCPKTRPWCCDELKEDMCDRIALMVEIHHTTALYRTKELRARSFSGKFYPHIAFLSLIHTFGGEIRYFSRCGVVSQSRTVVLYYSDCLSPKNSVKCVKQLMFYSKYHKLHSSARKRIYCDVATALKAGPRPAYWCCVAAHTPNHDMSPMALQ